MYLTDVENEIKFNNDSLFNQAVFLLKSTLSKKTYETVEHAARMENLVIKFSKYLSLTKTKNRELRFLARLHDIGKIAIPDSILNKKKALNKREQKIMSQHPEIGADIVSTIKDMDNIVDGIKYHHENYDGSGYPEGISGKNIPKYARIIAIADTYDALTTDRPYRKRLLKKDALKEIKKNANIQFDPELVEIFCKKINQRLKFN